MSIENNCYLKLAEVSPIFEKEDALDKENYGYVSVLSNVSRFHERQIVKSFSKL